MERGLLPAMPTIASQSSRRWDGSIALLCVAVFIFWSLPQYAAFGHTGPIGSDPPLVHRITHLLPAVIPWALGIGFGVSALRQGGWANRTAGALALLFFLFLMIEVMLHEDNGFY